ncbi:CIC11C00000004528 [Sungouiella intermedia]|uniref:CIC11C00000004528 n=1 Tax=Sungouiella intermedia TaxID=45354 RepID=A0A1L0D239_9ASCO|nr:CIC11C00000004528 [[Candida] intermedia]
MKEEKATENAKQKATRSKSGCFTCRARRKKCDEKRPSCSGCIRNNFACDWPMYHNQTLRDFRNHTLKSVPRQVLQQLSPQSPSQPTELDISSQEKLCLEYILGPFVKLMCPTPAADKIREHIEEQLLRDEVFRKVSICLGNFHNPTFGTVGHEQLLQNALESFRLKLANSGSNGMLNLDTLHSVSFLNFLELTGANRLLHKVVLHMETIFQIMCNIIADGTYLETTIFRACADSFYYNYGLVLLCSSKGEAERLPNVYNVNAIWKALHMDNVHDYELNPILGNKFPAISFINRACYIFRNNIVERRALAYLLKAEIDKTLLTKMSQHQEVLLKSAEMLILNILHRRHDEVDIQKAQFTKKCLAYLQELKAEEADFVIVWAYFICGVCIVLEEEKQQLRQIVKNGNLNPAIYFLDIMLQLIEQSWKAGKGLECLHEEEFVYELHEIVGVT